MSVAELVAPHIPSLRRFSRAMHGTQSIGDRHVADCLRAMVEEPPGYDYGEEAPVALFRHYLSRTTAQCRSDEGGGRTAERAGTRLSRHARNAFLLTALERFSISQTASILNVDAVAVEAYLAEANTHIESQAGTTVLIIEDEPLIAMDIESMVERFGHEVVGVARTRREAVMLARKMGPGLVLADVQLADGSSGIDAVDDIRTSLDVPAIFLTAFPQRLLTGDGQEPAFLITKPFDPDALAAMLSQVIFFRDLARSGSCTQSAAHVG